MRHDNTGNRTKNGKTGFRDRAGRTRPVPVIGIMGGIASGKSLVAAHWAQRGAHLIDADAIGHELLSDEKIKQALLERFGHGIFDREGRVDRRALAGKVFSCPADLEFLNALLHPPMRRRIGEKVGNAIERGAPAVVIDAALLLEHDLGASFCTHLVFIDAPECVRCVRAAEQRGWQREEVLKRESFQMPLGEKKRMADAVFNNESGKERMLDQADAWFDGLVSQNTVTDTSLNHTGYM